MGNPPPVKNDETPTTDTLLARWWVSHSWGYLFRRRQELGVARYGVPLQPFNGRDAILDASEEFQDGAVYTEQCIREGRLPVAVGAMVQILCLFALRVLWYYAGVATRERIVGLAHTDATEGVKADMRRRLLGGYERVEAVLEPTAMPLSALHQNPEKFGYPLLAGTYDPPDSQSDSWGLEDAPTLHLRAVVPSKVTGWGVVSATEAEESNDLETEPEPEQHQLQGFWSKNGPVYNDQHSWQWVGPGDNRGASVSRLMGSLWEDRLREENASLS